MAGLTIYLGCLLMLVGGAFGSTAAPDVMYTLPSGKGTYAETNRACKKFGEDFHIPRYTKEDQRIIRDAMKENVPEAWISMARTRYPMWMWLDNVPVDHNFAQQDWKSHMNCGVLHLRDNVVEVDNCTYRDFGFVCELPAGKDCLSVGVQETNCRVVDERTFALFCSSENWYDALYQCRQKGMELAVVRSGIIQADLSRSWYRQTKECSQVWIGLRREDWNYTSPDDKHIVQYHWAPGQPSQVGECAVVYKQTPQDWYLWKSVDCSSQQGRVCVRRLEPETTESPELPAATMSPLANKVPSIPEPGGSNTVGVAIGVSVSLVVVGLIVVLAFLYIRRRKRNDNPIRKGDEPAKKPLLDTNMEDDVSTTSSFESVNEEEVSSDPVMIGGEKVFDSSGGRLVIQDSDVVLDVPNGAVPYKKQYTIKALVHGDLNVPSLNLPKGEEEIVISPLIDITSTGHFQKYVTLTIPHKIYQKEQQQAIRAYYRQNDSAKWIKADLKRFEKNPGIFADVYFKLSGNALLIETKHFTQFVCTCKSEVRNIGLTGVLFAKYRDIGADPMEQEIQINVFVLEAVHSTRETLKALESEVAQNGTHQRMNMQIDLSHENLRAKDLLGIKLDTQEEWTYINGKEKEKSLFDIVSCHKPQLWVLAAEFVLQRDTPYEEALDGTRITLTFTVNRKDGSRTPKQTSYTHYIKFNKRQKRRRVKVKDAEAAKPVQIAPTMPVAEEQETKKVRDEETNSKEVAAPEKVNNGEDTAKGKQKITDEKDTKPSSEEVQKTEEQEATKKETQGAMSNENNPFLTGNTENDEPPKQETVVENQISAILGPKIEDPNAKGQDVELATDAATAEEQNNIITGEGEKAKLLPSEPVTEQNRNETETAEKVKEVAKVIEQTEELQHDITTDTMNAAEKETPPKDETKPRKKGGLSALPFIGKKRDKDKEKS